MTLAPVTPAEEASVRRCWLALEAALDDGTVENLRALVDELRRAVEEGQAEAN